MAETKYTYSIATDTANGKVHGGKLKIEIGASSIVIAVERIDTSGDVLDVIMKDALSAGDKTTLDGVVAAHDGEPLKTVKKVTQKLTAAEDLEVQIEGVTFDAILNGTKEHDHTLAQDIELQNVWCSAYGHTPGDYLELEIHHPVAGLQGTLGKKVYLPPSGEIVPDWSPSTKVLPAGLILKFRYVSIATTGAVAKIVCHIRQHIAV